MILLSGHSLTPERRVLLENMNLRLKERESTADIITVDMTGISTQSWMQDDTEPGKDIVWRVLKIQQAYADKTPTVTLEHAIGTLRDRILFGEITPETITGTAGATNCTARQAIEYILDQQSDWVLYGFDYDDVSNPYKFDGDNLFEALEKVTETLEEAWWSYDFSVYPFRLNIMEKPSEVACELRPGRNLVSLTKSIDRTGMYTRHYPIGKNDLHITGNYVSRNENLYGVSSKVEVDQSLETEAELRAWSNQRLSKHAEPVVNITADGLELAEATGESLDKLKLGRICRVPLHEFGTVIEERIVELNYRDKVGEPRNVRITMANNHDDVVRMIAEEIRTGGGRGGGGARGNARDKKRDLAWFEDTNSHVAMVAEGIVGVDAQGNPNWFRLSQIIADENGIDSSVQSIQGDIDDVNTWKPIAESRITQTEDSISQEVIDRRDADNQMGSRITQTATEIRSEVRSSLSSFYTAIIQTISGVVIRTGDATRTYHQPDEPTGTVQDPLVDGDLWFDAVGQFRWEDAEGKTWLEDAEYDWSQLKTNKIRRYNGTTETWETVSDEYALLQDTRFETTKEGISAVSARVDVVDGEVKSYRSEFQTTATELRSDYINRINGTESHITQTASQIRMEVANTRSELRSSITQEANRISLVVEGTGANAHIKPASIVAAINDGQSSVRISASKINLDGYVTASELNAINATIDNLMTGVTTANALKARAVYASTGFTYQGHAVGFKTVTIGSGTYHFIGY